MSAMEDEAILALYEARREEAVFETSKKYGTYCRSIAQGILHSPEDTDECVNDTWLRAWNAIPPKKPPVLSAFLGRITRNLAIDRCKLRMAEKRGGGQLPVLLDELEDCIPAPDSLSPASGALELAELLNDFLATLSPESRNIFVRRYWYFQSIREIARAYHITESKTATSLARSRQKLRRRLEEEHLLRPEKEDAI